MDNVDTRLLTSRKIKETFDSNLPCFTSSSHFKNTYLIKNIGVGDEAEATSACSPSDEKGCFEGSIWFAIKVTPNKNNETECETLKKCNWLVSNKVCPNLPLTHHVTQCNSCSFDKRVLKSKKCGVIVTEFAEYGDLGSYLMKTKVTPALVENIMFQICTALYSLHKHFSLTHNDLHLGNVLVHKTNGKGFWKYIIDNREYSCINMGVIITLWDFGLTAKSSLSADHIRVSKIIKGLYPKHKDLMTQIIANTNIYEVFPNVFGSYMKTNTTHTLIETYTL